MLKITAEGIYESKTGTNQAKFQPFTLTFEISKPNDIGILTHVQKRFIPYLIKTNKNFAKMPFTKLKSCRISDVQKIDDKCALEGKDIFELNEWELQDLACLYDLYNIPVTGLFSISEMREKAAQEYLERVLKVPMKTAADKDKLAFMKKMTDGTYKLDLGESKLKIQFKKELLKQTQNKEEKHELEEYLDKFDSLKTEENQEKDGEIDNDNMPNFSDLTI